MEHRILDKISHRSGETVPDGYFDQFKEKMKIELPERRWMDDSQILQVRRSFWQRIRPYTYLAAMFAGIWLLMNMFTLFQPARSEDTVSNQSLLAILDNEALFNEYVTSDIDDYELYDNLYDSGFDPSEVLALN